MELTELHAKFELIIYNGLVRGVNTEKYINKYIHTYIHKANHFNTGPTTSSRHSNTYIHTYIKPIISILGLLQVVGTVINKQFPQ